VTSVFHVNLVDLNEKNQFLPIVFVLPNAPSLVSPDLSQP
jgi:hypothetical protein